jgi:hypothetical protein
VWAPVYDDPSDLEPVASGKSLHSAEECSEAEYPRRRNDIFVLILDDREVYTSKSSTSLPLNEPSSSSSYAPAQLLIRYNMIVRS